VKHLKSPHLVNLERHINSKPGEPVELIMTEDFGTIESINPCEKIPIKIESAGILITGALLTLALVVGLIYLEITKRDPRKFQK